MNIIQLFFADVNLILDSYVTNTITSLSQELALIFKLAATVLVIFYGMALMRGAISAPLSEGIKRIFWISAISIVALNTGTYNDTVNQLFRYDVPAFIQDTITSNTKTTLDSTKPGAALDSIASRGLNAGTDLWEIGGLTNLPPLFLGAICWLATIAVVAMAAVLFFVATVALSILIALGPLFIIAWAFEPTKRFTELWLGQLVSFLLIQTFTVTIASFVVSIFEITLTNLQAAADASGQVNPLDVIKLTLIAVTGTLLLKRVESFASALSGGISLGMGAVAGRLSAPAHAVGGTTVQIVKGGTGYALGRGVRSIAGPEGSLPTSRPQAIAKQLQHWDGRDQTGWGPSWRRGTKSN